ncbi:RraA-like protein [Nadsonia fulvescens var. elongata DSM 6958]|uniref:RraA-like protein n=1 Tax=Nadsonia fulvescens var. elongata DSM 6958 TaxID=857566 RepID=A0A1E3PTN6_9ASCO|nr:RraA-like protein [Nadsonia fulvescens var. elongata DSM 6958]
MTDLIQKLSKYKPCDISDALTRYGIKSGGTIPHLIQQSPRQPTTSTIGPAYTVLFAALDDPRPAIKGGYIDSALSGCVLILATDTGLQLPYAPYTTLTNALYGGLMSTRAQYLGCAGTVVLGKIRDINEHRDLEYPVFSYGLGTAPPNTVAKVVAVGEILLIKSTMGDICIDAGDIVIADENGVVVLPVKDKVLLEKILNYIPQRVSADAKIAQDIKNGKKATEAQKEHRNSLP